MRSRSARSSSMRRSTSSGTGSSSAGSKALCRLCRSQMSKGSSPFPGRSAAVCFRSLSASFRTPRACVPRPFRAVRRGRPPRASCRRPRRRGNEDGAAQTRCAKMTAACGRGAHTATRFAKWWPPADPSTPVAPSERGQFVGLNHNRPSSRCLYQELTGRRWCGERSRRRTLSRTFTLDCAGRSSSAYLERASCR
jgi:hypothetical protein